VKDWKRNEQHELNPGSAAGAEHAASWVRYRSLSPLQRLLARDRQRSEPTSASGSEAVNIPSWMRDHELPPLVSERPGPNPGPSLGVVNIPAADGYHFGDDHPWGAEQQSALVTRLAELEKNIRPA